MPEGEVDKDYEFRVQVFNEVLRTNTLGRRESAKKDRAPITSSSDLAKYIRQAVIDDELIITHGWAADRYNC